MDTYDPKIPNHYFTRHCEMLTNISFSIPHVPHHLARQREPLTNIYDSISPSYIFQKHLARQREPLTNIYDAHGGNWAKIMSLSLSR